jgi:hypothetical protein
MDQAKQDHYLEVLRQTGSHAAARRDADASRGEVAALRRDDESFVARIDEAMELFKFEQVERPLHARAVNGVSKDIWWNGLVVGQEVVYSDRLLALLARANVEKYRDRVEVVNQTPDSLGLEDLSPESQAQLREILEREAKRKGEAPAPVAPGPSIRTRPPAAMPPRPARGEDQNEDSATGWD